MTAAEETSARCTLWDLTWDPRLRRILNSIKSLPAVDSLREHLFAEGITTLEQAKLRLNKDSQCMLVLDAEQRGSFLQQLDEANVAGNKMTAEST